MLVASNAEISEFWIVIHEGSITAARVAVANQMMSYFPSNKIHRRRSWIRQPLNVIESHSQFKSLFDFCRIAAVCQSSKRMELGLKSLVISDFYIFQEPD